MNRPARRGGNSLDGDHDPGRAEGHHVGPGAPSAADHGSGYGFGRLDGTGPLTRRPGRGAVGHDWDYILGSLEVRHRDNVVGDLAYSVGLAVLGLSVVGGIYSALEENSSAE